MEFAYIVVEGLHDTAVIGKMLELLGATQLKKLKNLDDHDEEGYWKKLARPTFPHRGNLTLRMPVPSFYLVNDLLVAVQFAEGDSALVKTLSATVNNLDDNGRKLYAVAMFCDADNLEAIEAFKNRMNDIKEMDDAPEIVSMFLNLESPGQILEGSSRYGMFVFPDNKNNGTLDTFLLECSEQNYSDLHESAKGYVESIASTYRERWKPTGASKALVGCIANALQPGTSNAVTIQKDDWICEATLTNEKVNGLHIFLKQLLNV